MEIQHLIIRTAEEQDAADLSAIYAPYVEHTAITFECVAPTEEEFRRRIRSTIARYPYLVAIDKGETVGYAYASAFRERAAFNWTVEISIYLRREAHGKGIGRSLYAALEKLLAAQGITNMNASVVCCDRDDEYLPMGSEAFHRTLGFNEVAHFHRCGNKFGRWYDLLWFEKIIAPQDGAPKPFIPFPELLQSGR